MHACRSTLEDPTPDGTRGVEPGHGLVLTSEDAFHRVTHSVYDDQGRLLSSTNPMGEITVVNTWNTDGTLATSTDAYGNPTSYEYDTAGRRTKVTNPDDSVVRYAYNDQGQLEWESFPMTAEEDALWADEEDTRDQVASHHTYWGNGQPHTTNTPRPKAGEEPIETSYTNTPTGQPWTTTVAGVTSKNIYDFQGRLMEVRSADETSEMTTVGYKYDSNGQRIAEKDEIGRETKFKYDAAGRLIRTTYPDGTFTGTAYDAAGRQSGTTDRNGNTSLIAYDAAGRQASTTDALNRITSYSYDDAGNLKTVTDPAGRKTTYHYDALNRRYKTDYPDGYSTRTEYDSWNYPNASTGPYHGRVQREFDQLDRKTEYRYDWAGRLLEVHQWKNQLNPSSPTGEVITKYEYDARGNRTAQVDALERRTEFVFDRPNRLREKHYPEVDSVVDEETYEYDEAGNLATKTTPKDEVIEFGYDLHNRMTSKSYPSSTFDPWSIAYTATGQRESVTRGDATWLWTYHPLTGRLTSYTDPFSRSLAYAYDANGNRTSVTTAPGNTTSFEFDALNRLTKVTDRFDQDVTYQYAQQTGVLEQLTYPNGTFTSYEYDQLNRVKSISHKLTAAPSTVLGSFVYDLGPTGRRNGVNELLDGNSSTVTYAYDDLDRLTEEQRTTTNPYNLEWTYDDVGNRLTEVRGGVTRHYSYDDRDRLLCENDAVGCTTPLVDYVWDANGNMAEKNGDVYDWDFENHLTSVTAGSTTTDFFYDLDDIRYAKKTGSGPDWTEYLVDPNRPYQEVVEEWSRTGSGSPSLAMEYALGGAHLWQRTGGGSPEQRWFHRDAQLSSRLLTTSSATIGSQLTYEAFGGDVALSSPAPTSHRYNGQQSDAATAGYYLRARYLIPTIGSFGSADPIQGVITVPATLHAFAYAGGNPINRSDPSGRMFLVDIAIAMMLISFVLQATTKAQPTRSPHATRLKWTFDDGPNGFALEIAAALAKYGVKAGFFFNGEKIKDSDRSVMQALHAQGHVIANHTWAHEQWESYSSEERKNSIRKTDDRIAAMSPCFSSGYWRAPFGNVHGLDPWAFCELGLTHVLWEYSVYDSYKTGQNCVTAECMVEKIDTVRNPKGTKGVVLAHEKGTTAGLLPRVLELLRAKGYQFESFP